MAAIFVTDSPDSLLKKFKKAIDDGKIKTWKYDNDGDFYHTGSQFSGQAWFRAKLTIGQLLFNIIKSKDGNISKFVYAYYHGHMIETLLFHFDNEFSTASATARVASGDLV